MLSLYWNIFADNANALLIPDITATFGNTHYAYDVGVMDPSTSTNAQLHRTGATYADIKVAKYSAAAQAHSVTFVPLCCEIFGKLDARFWDELRRISVFVSQRQGVDATLWFSYWRKRLQFRIFRAMVSPHLYVNYGRKMVRHFRPDIGDGVRAYVMACHTSHHD